MAGYTTPSWTNNDSPYINAAAMKNMGEAIELAQHPYGVCNTAIGTAAKVVTVDFSGTLVLYTGLTIRVKFSNGNSAVQPTLNVNSTGAKPIMIYGTTRPLAQPQTWVAGQIVEFVYDGTNWIMSGTFTFQRNDLFDSAAAAAVSQGTGQSVRQRPADAIKDIGNFLYNGVKMGTGTYTGTGTYGVNNPNSLTFSFVPVLLIVYMDGSTLNPGNFSGWEGSFIWMSGTTRVQTGLGTQEDGSANASKFSTFSLSGKKLSWWDSSGYLANAQRPSAQLNESGQTYHYIAFGV